MHAGAMHVVGVDPVALKREFAESVGATHTVASAEEAAGLARELSRGTGADVVVVTVGKMSAEVMRGRHGLPRQGRHAGADGARRPGRRTATSA